MPGQTTLVINNEQLSANLFDQVETLNAMKDHPYLVVEDMMAKADKIDSPGERTIVRWTTDDHSAPKRIVHGYENFKNFIQPILTPGHEMLGIVTQPVFISRIDEKRNSGKAELIKILRERIDQVWRHMRRSMQKVVLRGAAASLGGGGATEHAGVAEYEDFLSLNGADHVTGIVEDQISGTNTIHNLAKASFPNTTHEQFHNVFRDAAGDASANLLNAMYGILIALEIKDGPPNASEYCWYISQNAAEFLKQSLRGFEQYVSDGSMDDGMRKVTSYGGIKARPTAEMPNDGASTTADPWSALLVNWARGVNFRCVSGYAFEWDEFMDLPGTHGVRYSLCNLWGNLIALQNGLNGLVIDAEVF